MKMMMKQVFDFIQSQEVTFWLPYVIIALLLICNISQIIYTYKRVRAEKRISEKSLVQDRTNHLIYMQEQDDKYNIHIATLEKYHEGQLKMRDNRIKQLQDNHREYAINKAIIFHEDLEQTMKRIEAYYQFLNKKTKHDSRED